MLSPKLIFSSITTLILLTGCINNAPAPKSSGSNSASNRPSTTQMSTTSQMPLSSNDAVLDFTRSIERQVMDCVHGRVNEATCEQYDRVAQRDIARGKAYNQARSIRNNVRQDQQKNSWKNKYRESLNYSRYYLQKGDIGRAKYYQTQAEEYKRAIEQN